MRSLVLVIPCRVPTYRCKVAHMVEEAVEIFAGVRYGISIQDKEPQNKRGEKLKYLLSDVPISEGKVR